MKSILQRVIHRLNPPPPAYLPLEGDAGIEQIGHRNYVGGKWDQIGGLQFNFLVSQGLQPSHYLLDIACGALRLGVKAIPYLEPGHYLGVEKEAGLIKAGLETELDPAVREEKQPNIICSSSFEFKRLGQVANFAIAQSLFTHFNAKLIHTCFQRLHPVLAENGLFFATYFECDQPRKYKRKSHDHDAYAYTREEMLAFGDENQFKSHYIGDWNHPRDQVMVKYVKV